MLLTVLLKHLACDDTTSALLLFCRKVLALAEESFSHASMLTYNYGGVLNGDAINGLLALPHAVSSLVSDAYDPKATSKGGLYLPWQSSTQDAGADGLTAVPRFWPEVSWLASNPAEFQRASY